MPTFLTMNIKAGHWRILDIIFDAPNGTIKQDQIQAKYGTGPIMELLTELHEAGFVENTVVPVGNGKVRRSPHEHRMTAPGSDYYQRTRAKAPPESKEPISDDQKPAVVNVGRPMGAKNKATA